jgi:hypothetical protein
MSGENPRPGRGGGFRGNDRGGRGGRGGGHRGGSSGGVGAAPGVRVFE